MANQMEVGEIWVLTPLIYEGLEELPSVAPLPPCSHLMSRQPGLHIIMNSRSNSVTPVMRPGTLPAIALFNYKH